jgi:hypothetical protein
VLICSFCGAAQMAMIAAVPRPQPPEHLFAQEMELAKRIPSYAVVEGSLHVFNLVVGVTMIVAGIGALRLRPFARIAGSGAAAADLLMALVHGFYVVIVVFPVNQRILEEQMQNAPFNVADLSQNISWATLIFFALFSMAICLPIIGFLNAKKSRDAFAGKFEPDPYEERVARLDAFAKEDDGDDYGRPRTRPPKSPGDTGITGKPD